MQKLELLINTLHAHNNKDINWYLDIFNYNEIHSSILVNLYTHYILNYCTKYEY